VKTNVRGLVCAVGVLILSSSAVFLSGCTGLVSSANTTPPPPVTLGITNVQTGSVTTTSFQVVWTTSVPADSSVDYGTTPAYGFSTPIDSTMVTSHQVTVSGLAAGTTYFYQVNSTDSKNNHGKSGGYTLKTTGFNIAGTISPAAGGTGTTVTLSGAANTTATADSLGNYTFAGLPNGTYTIAPSHAGYMFTPASQSLTVNGANLAGVNFTDTAQSFSISGTISPTAGGSGATLTLSGAANATTTANSSGAYTFTGLASGSYTITPSKTGFAFTPVSQNVTLSTANTTGVNFTGTATTVAPTITSPPVNQTVTAGQTATFTAVAGGTAPLSYQWQKNGANIAGAVATSYTTPVTTTADTGSTFRVVVSNTAGMVTSVAATLTVNAAAAPGIQVSSSNINFGNDVVGSNSTQALIITNTGTATLTISQLAETGLAFNVSGFSLPLNVNAGQLTTITVAFKPTATGPASGSISIVSNAPSSPTSIGLNGTGIAPTLTLGISPTNLSFGNVSTGTSSATQNVSITNTGNSNVAISQISLSGAGYSMTGGGAPVTLTPSQVLTLVLQFTPATAGTLSGSISIVSNATGSPVTITLSGTGVTASQHSVALSWIASTSTVAGYNVYRSTVSGNSYTKINTSLLAVLNYTDSTVQNATTYYYVTTAVDSTGNESAYSNEVSAPIP
jgi:hypothetical protein